LGKRIHFIEKIAPKNFRHAENEMAVRNSFQDFLAEPLSKLHHPLLMTRGTKVPSLARKCKQVFMPAFTTPDPCTPRTFPVGTRPL